MTTLLEDQKMLQHEIYDEMKNSYIDYAMSVIVGRALPVCKCPTKKSKFHGLNAYWFCGH